MDLEYQKSLFNTNGDEIINRMKKLNISQRILDESLNILENWFKLQPHLPNISKDDSLMIKYLYMTSFSVEMTKVKLENLFTARSITPDFFTNRDPLSEASTNIMKCLQWVIMPKISKNNQRIIIVRFPNDLVEMYDPMESFRVACMILDMRLRYDTNFNDVYIADLCNMRLGHVLKLSPVILKNILLICQNCYISKIVSLHAVNSPQYAISLIKLTKSLLKKKIAERFFVHDNLDSLYKHVPRDELPIELGGKGESCADVSDKLYEAIQSNLWRKRFSEMNEIKSDESKRPESSRSSLSEEFGIIGSFRKLDID